MKAIFIAIIALCFAVQAQAQVQPKDTVGNNKKVNNTFWKGDSVYIGGTAQQPVWVHIKNASTIDTLGFCWGNDTTLSVRHAWGLINPGEWYNSPIPVPYRFIRRAVLTATDSVQSTVTSMRPSP